VPGGEGGREEEKEEEKEEGGRGRCNYVQYATPNRPPQLSTELIDISWKYR